MLCRRCSISLWLQNAAKFQNSLPLIYHKSKLSNYKRWNRMNLVYKRIRFRSHAQHSKSGLKYKFMPSPPERILNVITLPKEDLNWPKYALFQSGESFARCRLPSWILILTECIPWFPTLYSTWDSRRLVTLLGENWEIQLQKVLIWKLPVVLWIWNSSPGGWMPRLTLTKTEFKLTFR